jgi:hypothetical protein
MHWFAEVWSTEENQWHPVDCSDQERNYRMAWVLRVPKSAVLAPTGDRGGWNALPERRWDALTNTVGLFYPSGRVAVRVVDGARPVSNQRVLAQIWLEKQVVSVVAERTEVSRQQYLLSVTAACTDASGEAHFTLGQSARHPYRLAIDKPGDPDWQWLAVQSNRTYDVTLHIEQSKPFDKSVAPPPLGFPDWKGNPAR